MPLDAPDQPLQFDTAEYAGGAQPACAACKQQTTGEYFRANGQVFCARCRTLIENQLGSPGQLGRAALYGAGGAIAGGILYYAVLAITHLQIGLIAVAVGYMVGKAVRTGSGVPGGRKYQLLAVALTYISIAASYVPPILAARPDMGMLSIASMALSGPVVVGIRHPLGLVIDCFGLWQAWKLNQPAKVQFTGPYTGVHTGVPSS